MIAKVIKIETLKRSPGFLCGECGESLIDKKEAEEHVCKEHGGIVFFSGDNHLSGDICFSSQMFRFLQESEEKIKLP